jgi:diacylglycerol O-acyltransferase/trehalose O-mycolyltransferase
MSIARFVAALAVLLLLHGCDNDSGVVGDAAAATTGSLPPGAKFGTDADCPAPRCFDVQVPVPPGVHITDDHVRVLLPASYGSGRRYPVLYLLHDAPGTYKSWTAFGDALALTRGLELIVIMPDAGGGTDEAGWYSDWIDGSRQWETYHIDVMMPYLESHLDVLGDGHRAVAGASMGGFGAMSYSARHPGLFATAAGTSGAVDFLHLGQASALYVYLGHPLAGTPNDPIWGNPLTNYAEWQAHDPGTHVAGLAGMKIFLACGNGTYGGAHEDLAAPELYGVETLIRAMNDHFAQTLEANGVEHKTFFYGPGFHNFPYYRESLAWALPQMMAAIAP